MNKVKTEKERLEVELKLARMVRDHAIETGDDEVASIDLDTIRKALLEWLEKEKGFTKLKLPH